MALLRLLKLGLKWYDQKLYQSPYITQILSNGPLWGAGDLLAQSMENLNTKKKKPIDWLRVGRFSLYGFCVAGPLFAWWYRYIETRWMHLRLRGEWNKYLAAKIGCDQLLFEPPYLLQFFVTMGVLKGSSIAEIKDMVKEEYVRTFAVDTAVWPIVQAVNFAYVPPRFQAIYVNVVSLGWAGFLSLVTNPPSKEEVIHTDIPDDTTSQISKPIRY